MHMMSKMAGLMVGAADTGVKVQNVFATTLYTANGASRSITTGHRPDLVWIKPRNQTNYHGLWDTSRGAGNRLSTNVTSGESYDSDTVTAFNSDGFSLGADGSFRSPNFNGATEVAWTFTKAEKFFDIVTWSGNATNNRLISHGLGVAPGMIIIKSRTNAYTNWVVYHRMVGSTAYASLDTTNAFSVQNMFNDTNPTSTQFTVSSHNIVNQSGHDFVAYVFAHDTTSDGLIQCGNYTGNGSTSGPTITLGWEPQYLLVKSASGASAASAAWVILDSSRGINFSGNDPVLFANSTDTETSAGADPYIVPLSTGFQPDGTHLRINESGSSYVYMAIRKGPM